MMMSIPSRRLSCCCCCWILLLFPKIQRPPFSLYGQSISLMIRATAASPKGANALRRYSDRDEVFSIRIMLPTSSNWKFDNRHSIPLTKLSQGSWAVPLALGIPQYPKSEDVALYLLKQKHHFLLLLLSFLLSLFLQKPKHSSIPIPLCSASESNLHSTRPS